MPFNRWLMLAFIVLKLTNYIDWSRWWVLAPLWTQAIIVLLKDLLEKREGQ